MMTKKPILSKRDRSHQSFEEFKKIQKHYKNYFEINEEKNLYDELFENV